MKIKSHTFLLLTLCCGLTTLSQAALVTWNGDGDGLSWSDGDNWDNDVGPSNSDTFSITGATVNYDVSGLTLGVRSTLDNATLNLSASHLINIPAGNTTDPLSMRNGSFINITGGTHLIAGRIAYNNGTSVGGGINIIGSDAQLNSAQLVNWNPTFNFVFDADGVGQINYSSYAGINNATLIVDGSAYQGSYSPSGTVFPLINTANLLDQEIPDITVTGLGVEGNTTVGWILTQDQTTDDISITIFVPEPSRALLIFSSLAAIALRRKRR